MSSSEESKYVAGKNQVSCQVSGEAVILDMQTGVYYGLNAVGASIWKLLNEPRSIEELQTLIAAEYEIAPIDCRGDIQNLLNKLLEEKLIELQS